MNVKRMKKLIEAVEKIPDIQFDMSVWKEERDCGTVGCAVGAYCIAHPRAKLRIEGEGAWLHPRFGFLSDSSAIEDYFDIGCDDVKYLFSPYSYAITQKPSVLARLRKFVNDNTKG